jgi:AcrR family transcriptional regulator
MIKTRGRPKAFDEDAVVALAMEYFWEQGYENATLEKLLLAMGIKKSSFYHTFKSKEELFSRCLELYRNQNIQFLKSLRDEIGAKKSMFTLVNLTIEELAQTGEVKGCLIINSGKECYNKYDDLSRQVYAEFNAINTLFVEFVKEAQVEGEIKSKRDATIIAIRYMNALNGLVLTIQAGASKEMISQLVEHLEEILE